MFVFVSFVFVCFGVAIVMVVIAVLVALVVLNSRVPDQNGVSLQYIMLEIHHSGREPSKFGLF